jgi:hypothetical protein
VNTYAEPPLAPNGFSSPRAPTRAVDPSPDSAAEYPKVSCESLSSARSFADCLGVGVGVGVGVDVGVGVGVGVGVDVGVGVGVGVGVDVGSGVGVSVAVGVSVGVWVSGS